MVERLKDDLFLLDLLAKRSFEWNDEEKFRFLWNRRIVIGHYDRDRNVVILLTDLEDEEKKEVGDWLRENLQQIPISEYDLPQEEKEKNEKNRNRSGRNSK